MFIFHRLKVQRQITILCLRRTRLQMQHISMFLALKISYDQIWDHNSKISFYLDGYCTMMNESLPEDNSKLKIGHTV